MRCSTALGEDSLMVRTGSSAPSRTAPRLGFLPPSLSSMFRVHCGQRCFSCLWSLSVSKSRFDVNNPSPSSDLIEQTLYFDSFNITWKKVVSVTERRTVCSQGTLQSAAAATSERSKQKSLRLKTQLRRQCRNT